jgi:hypothetical protein
MKSIRITGNVRQIAESDRHVTLFRIQEILTEHRSLLIMRILQDLPTYLEFKFYVKVDKDQQQIVRDKLSELSNAKVNLDRYDVIVQEIKRNDTYRVPSQLFFNEIDLLLDTHLNPSQLQLIQ